MDLKLASIEYVMYGTSLLSITGTEVHIGNWKGVINKNQAEILARIEQEWRLELNWNIVLLLCMEESSLGKTAPIMEFLKTKLVLVTVPFFDVKFGIILQNKTGDVEYEN